MTDDREHGHGADAEEGPVAERQWDAPSFLTGVLLGAAIGAGIALLFAPGSGEETRRLVRKKARSLTREAGEGYLSARDETRKAIREKKEALRARLTEGLGKLEDRLGG
jgi:gas vesicle protein